MTSRTAAAVNAVLVGAVLMAVVAITAMVDPFCGLGGAGCTPIPRARHMDRYAWLLARFQAADAQEVIIGNSRVDGWCPRASDQVLNLGSGGQTLPESLGLLEMAAGKEGVRRIVVGIDLPLFDGGGHPSIDRLAATRAWWSRRATYLVHPTTVRASWREIRGAGVDSVVAPAPLDSLAWARHLEDAMAAYYDGFTFDVGAVERLAASVAAARAGGVEVTVVLLPAHRSYRDAVAARGLHGEYGRLVDGLERGGAGPVRDARDQGDDLLGAFRDALHPAPALRRLLEDQLMGPGCRGPPDP